MGQRGTNFIFIMMMITLLLGVVSGKLETKMKYGCGRKENTGDDNVITEECTCYGSATNVCMVGQTCDGNTGECKDSSAKNLRFRQDAGTEKQGQVFASASASVPKAFFGGKVISKGNARAPSN